MIIYRKRNGGLEIDYLVFSVFRYKFWITKSKYYSKYPRLIIWKMSKNPNIGVEKAYTLKIK
jgi:hypothetical protein